MAKVCSETLKVFKEIFDEAYLMGRSSGSEGIFICPDLAFEAFMQEKLMELIEDKSESQMKFESEVQFDANNYMQSQPNFH